MQEVIRFALLGLGLGALYALASQGLIAIYRGSGVLNFALGATGMVGAYVDYQLNVLDHVPFLVSLPIGVAASAIVGAATQLIVMRPLRKASSLARVVATLGILTMLQSAADLLYGGNALYVPSSLPLTLLHPFGVTISLDRPLLLLIGAVCAFGLWWVYRFTRFGIGTTAVAENERAAATLGLSPGLIATVNWALGSALAGLAAILVAPIITLSPSEMTSLLVAALAAALVAGFRSFSIAFAAGMFIGIVQTELQRYVTLTGASQSFPFVVIVVMLIVSGRSLPLRDFFLERLPRVGTGRIRLILVVPGVAVAAALIGTLPVEWVTAISTTFASGLVLLSIVVITGYAGQVSLAQVAISGFGAWIAGRAVAAAGWPFLLATLAGVAAAIPLGLAFALPAVRTRGMNLAIVTLGLGTAIELMVFDNGSLTGGVVGTTTGSPNLFGWNITAFNHPARYAFVTLGAFVLVAMAVANLRRGRSGKRLLAVRANERAAAALGVSVHGSKLYAFAVSAGIAALGGILLSFQFYSILYGTQFMNVNSLLDVAWAFLGGIGYVMGPLVGSFFSPGTVGAEFGQKVFGGLGDWIALIGGAAITLQIIANQDGIVRESIKQWAWIGRRSVILRALSSLPLKRDVSPVLPPTVRHPANPQPLGVEGLTVSFGAVTAVSDVSLTVAPGELVGLIGPNGAGKTTLIDAVTGFAKPTSGRITIGGRDITTWSATKRARAGISRSFQGLELFEDLTVLDNLRVAADPRDRLSYVSDLIWPRTPPLPAGAVAAIKEFGLEGSLLRSVEDLSYGERRLLAIARAIASEPSVLLLDEPAAGLSSGETAELGHLVRRLADDWGFAILLIEHDVDFVMSTCDRVVVLDFGKNICEGPAETVRRDPAVVAAYLGEAPESPAVIGASEGRA